MKGKFLVGPVAALIAGALLAAPAAAHTPQFYNHEPGAGQEALRSVASIPPKTKLQPDAMEFVNNGPVEFTIKTVSTKKGGEETKLVFCTEIEFGTTVVSNSPEGKGEENTLALPFGVAEGDSCKTEPPTAAVRTYFDTTAAGWVPATITFKGGPPNKPIFATIHELKLSMNFEPTFCTIPLEAVTGEVVNLKGFPGEEEAPNLELVFSAAKSTGFATCEGSKNKYEVSLTAHFLLETMSTLTDTVWVE